MNCPTPPQDDVHQGPRLGFQLCPGNQPGSVSMASSQKGWVPLIQRAKEATPTAGSPLWWSQGSPLLSTRGRWVPSPEQATS